MRRRHRVMDGAADPQHPSPRSDVWIAPNTAPRSIHHSHRAAWSDTHVLGNHLGRTGDHRHSAVMLAGSGRSVAPSPLLSITHSTSYRRNYFMLSSVTSGSDSRERTSLKKKLWYKSTKSKHQTLLKTDLCLNKCYKYIYKITKAIIKWDIQAME